MRDNLLGAVIGQRQKRAARLHHSPRPLRDSDKAVDRDVHGHQEIVHRRIDELAPKLILVGIADRVDDEVEPVPALAELGEGSVERLHAADVAVDEQVRSELRGEGPNALLQCLALVGKSELGTLVTDCPRNTPRQRTVVGEAHDQPALTLHQSSQS